jgi:hypothetical protein
MKVIMVRRNNKNQKDKIWKLIKQIKKNKLFLDQAITLDSFTVNTFWLYNL